ncbi:uncharacterized protein [Littorina saxatilis]|uniref:Protein quiver n=1 Tax=Littorina saxatilis TaxID=31220 RepID=A0AAN9AVY4_9CAEN
MTRHFASSVFTLTIVIILTTTTTTTTTTTATASRVCYNCHLEPGRNECVNAGQLQEARVRFESSLRHNLTLEESRDSARDLVSICPDTMQFCVIERMIRPNQLPLMYRDCSDGVHFAMPTNGTRLVPAPKDNNTHCALPSLSETGMLCITLCQDDLCNGPTATARLLSGSAGLLVLCWLMSRSIVYTDETQRYF